LRGTHKDTFLGFKATGKPVDFTGISMFSVVGGQITEMWGHWEQASLLQQIGAVQWPQQPGQPSGQPGGQPGSYQPGSYQPGGQPGGAAPDPYQSGGIVPDPYQAGSSDEQNEAVARKWVEAVNSGDLQALDQTVDYNVIDHSGLSSGHGHGCEGHKRLVSELRKAFPDWRASVDDVTVNGDLVTIRYSGRGANPEELKSLAGSAPAEKMDFKLVSTVRIKNGKVVEHWANEGPLGQKGGPTSAASPQDDSPKW